MPNIPMLATLPPSQIEKMKEKNLTDFAVEKIGGLWDWMQGQKTMAESGPYKMDDFTMPYGYLIANYNHNKQLEEGHPITSTVVKSVQDAVKFAVEQEQREKAQAQQAAVEAYPQATSDGYEFAQSWQNTKPKPVVTTQPTTQPEVKTTAKSKQVGGTKLKTANKVAKAATTSTKPAVVKSAPLPAPSTAPTTFTDGYATYHIPRGEFTHQNDVSNVRINPVAVDGDNGGLQHVAMNALYKPQNAPMSLGEMIAFASIMQGKKTFGGINDITATMQDADKMNAYAAQAAVGNQVQALIAQGRTPEEARYEALSSYLSAQGNDRAAIAVANPEFQKFADQRAGRTLDVLAGVGGDYIASPNSLGYTPYGINNFSVKDGTMTVNGQKVTGIIPEAVQGAVYAAVTGKGDGALKQRDFDQQVAKTQWDMEKDIATLELDSKKSGGAAKTYDQLDPYTKAYLTELGKRQAEAEVRRTNQTGVDLSGLQSVVGL